MLEIKLVREYIYVRIYTNRAFYKIAITALFKVILEILNVILKRIEEMVKPKLLSFLIVVKNQVNLSTSLFCH